MKEALLVGLLFLIGCGESKEEVNVSWPESPQRYTVIYDGETYDNLTHYNIETYWMTLTTEDRGEIKISRDQQKKIIITEEN